MRTAALLLLIVLAACAGSRRVIEYRTINVPVPLVVEKRVVVYERPHALVEDRALLDDYAATKPTVDAAVLKTQRPAAINRLVALDARARQSIRDALRPHHTPTRDEISDAQSRLAVLKAAALDTTH